MVKYSYATLNDPFATAGTVAQSINDTGQIVGWYQANSNAIYGFLYTAGNYAPVNYALSFNIYPFGINDHGHIVGLIGGGNNEHGFLYRNGTYTILDDPSGTFGPIATTIAMGINDADQIVGAYRDIGGAIHAFLYRHGTYKTLDDPLGIGTIAYGINNAGQIVGDYGDNRGHQHGLLYSRGNYTTIDDPLGTSTVATGINDAGQIVGYYTDVGGHIHGFLYDRNNYTTLNDPLAVGGGQAQTVAYGINNSGQIVGFYKDSAGLHGFIATPTHGDLAVTVVGLNATQVSADLHLI
jgi:probable HAF family extracellular repeat protein